ncbi:MAG: hypothetical protein WCG10_06570 [Chlamydiota bacterium]
MFKLKKDQYRSARGGYSRFLNIYCKKCNGHVLLYQKDGPGPLKRLYVDRIIAPNKEASLLICDHCKLLLATPYIYEKESRSALLLKENAITKKLTKGIYPPLS